MDEMRSPPRPLCPARGPSPSMPRPTRCAAPEGGHRDAPWGGERWAPALLLPRRPFGGKGPSLFVLEEMRPAWPRAQVRVQGFPVAGHPRSCVPRPGGRRGRAGAGPSGVAPGGSVWGHGSIWGQQALVPHWPPWAPRGQATSPAARPLAPVLLPCSWAPPGAAPAVGAGRGCEVGRGPATSAASGARAGLSPGSALRVPTEDVRTTFLEGPVASDSGPLGSWPTADTALMCAGP